MSIVYLILLVFIVFILVRWAFGIMKSLLVSVLVLGVSLLVLYFGGIVPFEEKNIAMQQILSSYCEKGDEESLWKCNCILQPVNDELQTRFSAQELKALEQDRIKYIYVLRKSFVHRKEAIQNCLENKGVNASAEKVFYGILVKEAGAIQLNWSDWTDWSPELPSLIEEIDRKFE